MPKGEQQSILAVPLAFLPLFKPFCLCLKNPILSTCVAHPYRIIPSFVTTAFPSIYESTLNMAQSAQPKVELQLGQIRRPVESVFDTCSEDY